MPYQTKLRLTETPCAVYVARDKVQHLIKEIKNAGGTIYKQHRYAEIIKNDTPLTIQEAQELVEYNYGSILNSPTPYFLLCDIVPKDIYDLHYEICQDSSVKSSTSISIGGDI